MPDKPKCPECGAELPANAPQGLCPRCLVGMGLSMALATKHEPSKESPFPASGHTFPVGRGEGRGQGLQRIRYFGDYELLEEIARGGMGVVYRARQVSLDRIVAVKMLLLGKFSSDEFVKRFQSEAQAVASLQHPNIVAIHEIGEHEGQHYFSMDYVAGKNLAEVVRDGPLPSKRAAAYLKTIANAVHFAHNRGVLHRDLKPSNVLIDAADQPCVTDFGLAKQLNGENDWTTTGHVLGSPNFMPPEQASGRRGKVGTHSDVYSLGSILYHLLTGRPPFVGETVAETLTQVLNNEPVPSRLLNPSVPRDLETICLKCLEKNPQRRYSSAHAVAEDLDCFLRGEPIRARPVRPPEKLWRWSRRKPALAATFVLLCILAVGSTWTAFRLRRMQEQARQLNYANDMNLALRDFTEGNTASALERLKRHIPTGRQTDLRGFEWRYLWHQCRGSYSQWLPVHRQIVGDLQFSPDGKRVAAYSWNNALSVWNLETQGNLFTAEAVTSFGGFSADGSVLVAGRADESLQLLQAGTGVTNRVFPEAGAVVAWSAKSQSGVTIGRDEILKVWSLTNSQVRFALTNVARRKLDFGWNYPIALSPDGNTLVMIKRSSSPLNPDVAIRLWDVTAQQELPSLLLNRQVRCLEFSPDGKVLAIGDGEGNVLLWSSTAWEHPPLILKVHEFPVLSLAFSPDSQTLSTGSSDKKSIRLWDVATGSPKPNTFPGQIGDVWSLVFSPDGKRLASGTRDGPIRIWNLDERERGEIVEEHLHAHDYGNFIFSPDSKWMAGGCADDTVKIWEVATLKVRGILTNAKYVAAFSKDGRRVLVSSLGGAARWRNVEDTTEQGIPHYAGNLDSMIAVDLTPDRQVAALGLTNGWIQLWEIESGQPTGSPLHGHTGPVRSLAISPAGDKLASGGVDKWVKVWDMKTGKLLGGSPEHKGSVCAVAISPDGKTLASGCGAETIKLWNLSTMSTGSLVSISYHKSVIRSLAFSPDSKTLASGSEDRTLKLWNVAMGREVVSFKHEDHLRLVVFSPDGNTLASVTDNGTLRVFRAVSLKEADENLSH